MRNLSFSTKTSLVASLVVGLIAAFGFGVFAYYTYQNQKETLFEKVRYSTELHADSFSHALAKGDQKRIDNLVQKMLNNPSFLGVRVFDANNNQLAFAGSLGEGQYSDIITHSIFGLKEVQGKVLGRLEVYISTYEAEEMLDKLIRMGALFISIIILLLMFSIILTLRLATITLNNVTSAMEKYALGDKSVEVPNIKSDNEVGRLAKTFKIMKTEIDSFQQGLEQKVLERTSELQEAKRIAEQANDAKSRFISAVSHELRTPLSSIIGFSGMISQQVFGPIENVQYQEYIRNINESGEHLMKVINDLLDLSKAEACRLELENIEFNVRKVFDKAKTMFAVRAMESGIDLVLNIDSSVPNALVGDPVRIKQVLINIVGNAMKFTERGSVSISASYDNESSRMDIEIADTGIGIPEDKIGKLFQQFSQTDVSTYRKFGGTGLGLAITKTLVELMKGQITVESQVGVGTKFKLFLILNERVAEPQ